MGFRFHRSLKILPGVRLNFSKSGVSTSVGVRGAHVTFGHGHVRETVGVPGTGISYTTTSKSGTRLSRPAQVRPTAIGVGGWIVIIFLFLCLYLWLFSSNTAPEPAPLKRTPPATATVNSTARSRTRSPDSSRTDIHGLAAVGVDSLNVRDSPNGRIVGTLSKDELVNVYELKGGWCRISVSDAAPRWVFASMLKNR